jgi:hypothetical protein
MSDTYEVLTILQVVGKEPKVLRRVYLDVEYETNDRDSFVYTRTRKINFQPKPEHHGSVLVRSIPIKGRD